MTEVRQAILTTVLWSSPNPTDYVNNLGNLGKGEVFLVLEKAPHQHFKVLTADGRVGYVKVDRTELVRG